IGLELRQGDRAGWQELMRLVEGLPDEHLMLARNLHVNASLTEVLARGPVEHVQVLGDASAKVRSIRLRVQIEIRPYDRVDSARASSRGWHRRRKSDAEVFLKPLVAAKEENAVLADRPPGREAILIPLEWRRAAHVEVVRCVELAVAEEFERRSAV